MLPIPKRRIRWLTREEVEKLLAELPGHIAEAARFSLATGLRKENVIGLEWSQVDLESRSPFWLKLLIQQLTERSLHIVSAKSSTKHNRVGPNFFRAFAPRFGVPQLTVVRDYHVITAMTSKTPSIFEREAAYL